MELGGAGQSRTDLRVEALVLEGLIVLASRVLPDH